MLELVATGLSFPESPRWHGGRLLFADMGTRLVQALATDGKLEVLCEVPGQPAGLGFSRDGRLLVVSMLERRLLRLDDEGLTEVADLAPFATGPCNDMVVDERGRAWIGEFGFGYEDPARTASLIRVDPDGTATRAADRLWFPNGCAVAAGPTLLVAETLGQRVSAFGIDADGRLSDRRTWAAFAPEPATGLFEALDSGHITPDGMCLDAEGLVWVADIAGGAAVRVREGGEVVQRLVLDQGLTAYAVGLGGEDGRTLFVCAGPALRDRGLPDEHDLRGCVLAARVAVPAG